MTAAGDQHVRAARQIDEHQIGRARQQVGGPVRGIGPQQRAGTAVPAHAAADRAGITQYLAVADGQRAVTARQGLRGEATGQRAGDHDVRLLHRRCVAGELGHDQCAAERGAAADHQCVGAGIAAFDLQRAAGVLHEIAGDGERAGRIDAARAQHAAVGERARTEGQRAETAERAGVADACRGVRVHRARQQIHGAGVDEGAGQCQRALAQRERAGLGEYDTGRDGRRSATHLGERAVVGQRAGVVRTDGETAVATVEQQAGTARVPQQRAVVQVERTPGLVDAAAATGIRMHERATVQHLGAAAADLQRPGHRQGAGARHDACRPFVTTGDGVGPAALQRAAALAQRRCDRAAVGQNERAATQRQGTGAGNAAFCGKAGGRGTPHVEGGAGRDLLRAVEGGRGVGRQQALLHVQRAPLIEPQRAVVAEVERTDTGLGQRTEVFETAATARRLVEVQRALVVGRIQREYRAFGILEQRTVVYEEAATVVVADATGAGCVGMDEAGATQNDVACPGLGQHAIHGDRAAT